MSPSGKAKVEALDCCYQFLTHRRLLLEANLGSPDSQYGFSSTPTVDGAPYTVLDPRTSNCAASVPPGTDITEGGFYSWGPPPPYASNRNSANNSPARRSLGEILHQVSPIRRNDNVSPLRPYHHVHHHHVHHPHTGNHQCTSSTRQAPAPSATSQPNCLQKNSTPPRPAQLTEVLQQQRSGIENNLRSNSLTSVHRLQKFDQGKDNYENMYESEAFPSTNGFNTLPSLKKRNQSRASELFQNETTSAYYFSSAENLGCSESNNTANEGTFRNESLPPRVFLVNDGGTRGSTPRRGSGDANACTKHQPKSSGDPELEGEHHASRNGSESNVLPQQACSRAGRTPENGNSFVKKLFVSCSPTKQKHVMEGEPQGLNGEKRDGLVHLHKKKVGKRLAPSKEPDSTNENVITFHYRLGIPRSPNIHNLNQFAEKTLKVCENVKEECSGEAWGGENQGSGSEESRDARKVLKGFKYVSKDVELLQKHGSLMKEFNKNVDLQKNLKCKSEKTPTRNAYDGVENKGFQNVEDCPRGHATRPHPEVKHNPIVYQPPLEFRGKSARIDLSQSELDRGEDYQLGNSKNETESDVYFGDISNSSCYVSVQNEGADSSLYEEAGEKRSGPGFQVGGQSLLSKQNVKRIEDESAGYNDIGLDYEHAEHSDNSSYGKLQDEAEGYHQNHRNRGSRAGVGAFRYLGENRLEEAKKDDSRAGPSDIKPPEAFAKPIRSFLVSSSYGELDSKSKYFNLGACYQDHYREASNSNDEHSSSSLTVDSGISTGRNYLSRCYDSGYQELDCAGKTAADSTEARAEACFETLNERFSNIEKFQPCKISNLDNISEFSHPLFQKPKVIPRGNRYREGDVRQKKSARTEADKEQENECEGRKGRAAFATGAKRTADAGDAMSNSSQFASESECVDSRFEHSKPKTGDDGYQKQKSEEAFGKSPKPLPRTTVSSGTALEAAPPHSKHGKYVQNKEKQHFLAPDAQYEYKDNYRTDFKQKGMGKKSSSDSGKPTVPARPLNLQERCRNMKMDPFLFRDGYCKNEGSCPLPRRRQQRGLDDVSDKIGSNEIGNHSVNV